MTTIRWKLAAGSALLSLCSLAALGQSAEPQQPPPGDGPGNPHGEWRGAPGPERELHMLTHMLNLTADQQTGVKAVLEQQRTQMESLRAKNQSQSAEPPSAEARQAHMTEVEQIRDESNTKIAALLDENQKKTFSDWVAKRKAEMARRQANGDGPPPPPPPSE